MSSALRNPLPFFGTNALRLGRGASSVEQAQLRLRAQPLPSAALPPLKPSASTPSPAKSWPSSDRMPAENSTLLKLTFLARWSRLSAASSSMVSSPSSLTAQDRAPSASCLVQHESRFCSPPRAWEFVLQGPPSPHGSGLRFETQDDVTIAHECAYPGGRQSHLSDRWMDKISGGEKRASFSLGRPRSTAAPPAAR